GRPVGRAGRRPPVVGVVRDAQYKIVREPILPVLYVPIYSAGQLGAVPQTRSAAFMVRISSGNPLAMASILRNEIPRVRPEFRVSNLRNERELVDAQTVR